jgi:hypothetical protein
MKRKCTKQALIYWHYHKQGVIPTEIFPKTPCTIFPAIFLPETIQSWQLI